jgi:hypothetical protein
LALDFPLWRKEEEPITHWDEASADEKLELLKDEFLRMQRVLVDLVPKCQRMDERLEALERKQQGPAH